MADILLAIFIVISIVVIVVVEVMTKKGKLMQINTYSYKAVLKRSVIHLNVALILSSLTYLFSKSIEITITLGLLFMVGVFGGLFYGLLWEYQTKRRGGERTD